MTRTLRTRHRRTMATLAALLPTAVVVALASRAPLPASPRPGRPPLASTDGVPATSAADALPPASRLLGTLGDAAPAPRGRP